MRRIAHLSDVHIVDGTEKKGARYRLASKFVGVGRNGLGPQDRAGRLARALAVAKANGADHVVISGDLTELGHEAEFERFAEVLHDARLPEDSVTLVPGNHDAYSAADGWTKAMAGPLARFSTASAADAGKVVDRGNIAFLPIDTTQYQSIARSSGVFTETTAQAIERRALDPAFRDKTLVLVLHHPPFHPVRALRWIDGLRGGAYLLDLLARFPRLQLLHGHLHRIFDHIVATSSAVGAAVGLFQSAAAGWPRVAPSTNAETRLFGAPATCEGPSERPNIRFYDLVGGSLRASEPFLAA